MIRRPRNSTLFPYTTLFRSESRRATRTTLEGNLVPLADQDRHRWDRALIAEGQSLVRRCLEIDQPGYYQLQAAITAVHSDAPRSEEHTSELQSPCNLVCRLL